MTQSGASVIRQARPPFPPFADDLCYGGASRTWLVPRGITRFVAGMEAAGFFPLAGGPLGFDGVDVVQRSPDGMIPDGMTIAAMAADRVMAEAAAGGDDAEARAGLIFGRLTRPRAAFAGLNLTAPVMMGVINTTPDSFSDGGSYRGAEEAIAAGRKMAAAGAKLLDIGGESTRPGASPISRDEERRRILPVITALAGEGYRISVDTRHSEVMRPALEAGAVVINDVSGLRDEGAAELAVQQAAPAIIMHMQGDPGTMQKNPRYTHAPSDVFDWLEERLNALEAAGLSRVHMAVDPGFGFGKTPRHNMEIMAHIGMYHGLGVPIVLGVSRKSTIGHYGGGADVKERLPGSLALAALGRRYGVQIFRVHDVAETAQALSLTEAMLTGG